MSTRLEFLNGQIHAKRQELSGILTGKPNMDFTTEELGKIKGLNDDLATLSQEAEPLKGIKGIIDETEAYLSKHNPIGESLPGQKGDGKPVGIVLPNGEAFSLRDEKGEYLSDSAIQTKLAEFVNETTARKFAEMQSGGAENPAVAMTDAFLKSAAFLKYDPTLRKSPTVELEVKTLLDTTGFPVFSQRSNMLLPFAMRRPVVADLLPNGTIAQPQFIYMEETTATNNAAPVAEGAQKPESALAFEEKTAQVRKIATVLPVTDELFQDAPAMRSYVQGRMTVFLQLAEENQILNGNGTPPALEGIYDNSGIQSQAKGADTIPDAIYKAATKIEVNSFLSPTGVVIHPNDWQRVRLLKDSAGNYLFGSPLAGDIERIFGYAVVKTQATAEGKALVGAWDTAAMILRRTGISFAVSTEHAEFFIYNKLMLRIEERLALPVFRPKGFCEVTGLNA